MKASPFVVLLLGSLSFAGVSITTSSLPNGTANSAYATTIKTLDGSVPFVWSVPNGNLPAGLTLIPSASTRTAILSGTPTTVGTYNFSISVKGYGGHVSTVAYSLTVEGQTAGNVVDLSWDAVGGNIAGYNVFRSTTQGGPYSQLNPSLVASTSYSDSTVSSGMTYYYVTTAVNSAGEQSAYSAAVKAVIPNN